MEFFFFSKTAQIAVASIEDALKVGGRTDGRTGMAAVGRWVGCLECQKCNATIDKQEARREGGRDKTEQT